MNTVNPSIKRGFPFDQPADCWFPTWDPFECVCLCRDSQRPESHTRHALTKGSGTANIEQSQIEEMLRLRGGLHGAVVYASLCICTSPGQTRLFP